MEQEREPFLKPSPVERIFNRVFGFFVSAGIGPRYGYVLEVRGRKSGRLYSTPVNLLEVTGRRYLVCPRGRAQWVRNAEANGRITLKKGSRRINFGLRAVTTAEKAALLKAYLDRFKTVVQRYFPVPAGSPADAFEPYLDRYPVFELTESTPHGETGAGAT